MGRMKKPKENPGIEGENTLEGNIRCFLENTLKGSSNPILQDLKDLGLEPLLGETIQLSSVSSPAEDDQKEPKRVNLKTKKFFLEKKLKPIEKRSFGVNNSEREKVKKETEKWKDAAVEVLDELWAVKKEQSADTSRGEFYKTITSASGLDFDILKLDPEEL